ncbi:MAG: hypothetical protein WAU85_04135 [Candidatus Absconditicoccaceae bacterium]
MNFPLKYMDSGSIKKAIIRKFHGAPNEAKRRIATFTTKEIFIILFFLSSEFVGAFLLIATDNSQIHVISGIKTIHGLS